jgi:hypothetical protein
VARHPTRVGRWGDGVSAATRVASRRRVGVHAGPRAAGARVMVPGGGGGSTTPVEDCQQAAGRPAIALF